MHSDEYYINKTFQLARKAQGKTSPNPMVGCVIVKNNKVIASGYHKKAGMPHAEIEALKKVQGSLKGSTLYVNLEPCAHWGKTPPCVDEITGTGIKRVVIATKDPHRLVNGRSISKLRKAGIKVTIGLKAIEAKRLNEVFFVNMTKLRPFVVVKVAQTIDGKIANPQGRSKWITSGEARSYARTLRALHDGILVGINTVIKDDPRLTSSKRLIKIILDPSLRIPLKARLFREAKGVIIITKKNADSKKEALLRKKAKIIKLAYGRHGFDTKELLRQLYLCGVCSVFVEGGSATLGRFFDQKLVDKLYIFISPKVMGKKDALSAIAGAGGISIEHLPKIADAAIEKVGRDFLFTGYPKFT